MATVRGRGEVKARVARLAEAYPRALQAAMQSEAAEILSKAKVNVRTGEMRSTAFVAAPQGTGRGAVIRFGFAKRYAIYVNRKFKFFSNALRSSKRGILGRLAKRVKENLSATPAGDVTGVPTQIAVKKKDRRRRENR